MATFDNEFWLFFARWISHFCAPGFFWSMGVAMTLFTWSRMERSCWTPWDIRKHYLIRGCILLLMDRIVNPPFILPDLIDQAEGRTNPNAHHHEGGPLWQMALIGIFEVCTGLGLVMITVGLMIPTLHAWHKTQISGNQEHSEGWWNMSRGQLTAAILAVVSFVLSNVLLVHYQGPWGDVGAGTTFPQASGVAHGLWETALRFIILPGMTSWSHISYPLIPWIGVSLCGVAMGVGFKTAPEKAHTMAGLLGILSLVAFNLIRGFGGPVGNLRGWPRGDGHGRISVLIEWFNVCKYPPSLAFALLTVGANLVALSGFWTLQQRCGAEWIEKWLQPLLVFGRAPLFFYMVHFWLYACTGMGIHAAGFEGVPLPWCIPFWLSALFFLFFVVRPYGAFKAKQHPDSLWRLL